MLKKYKMPNGRTYQFDERSVPAGAVPVEPEKKAEEKPKAKAKKTANKAKKPANKAKKAAVKK